MAEKDYVIKREDWEVISEDELNYIDEDLRFGVRCMVDLKTQRVRFGLYSTTYAYGSVNHYYDCLPGWHEPGFRAYLYEHDLKDFFFKNGTIKYVHIPAEVIDTVISWNEEEDYNESIAYEFCVYAAEHGLKTDDCRSLRQNVGAYLCRTTVGGMSYGFGNVPEWQINEICGYIEEFYLLHAV